MSQTPSWSGHERPLTVPTPSWMAPPLGETFETSNVRVSLPPPQPPLNAVDLLPVLPNVRSSEPAEPVPPAYPDLRLEHAALTAECAAMRIQLKSMADAMGALRSQILEASEPEVVRLACAIGERIAAHALSLDPSMVVGWVREALVELGGEEPVVVAVASDLAKTLGEGGWAQLSSACVRIETDPSLAAGACEVRAARASLDASLGGRTAAVRREVQDGAK